jgi:hypothetical protein
VIREEMRRQNSLRVVGESGVVHQQRDLHAVVEAELREDVRDVGLDDVAPLAKFAHNTAGLVVSLALGAWAARRNPRRSSSARPTGTAMVD